MQCVILAGGLATRMRPMTETLPKALLPVGGRPFIDYQLEWMAKVGVSEAVLSVGYRGEMLCEHVGDGSRWGLPLKVVSDGPELRGTAGALRTALDAGVLDESFLVTYGDSFLPVDFRAVWEAFLGCNQPALMSVFHNRGLWDQSNVVFEDGRVLYDKQRLARPKEHFDHIDYGLCALQRSVIALAVPRGVKADLAALLHSLSIEGKLAGFEVHERFYEIGSPRGLEDFERWIANSA
jgi:NDP-sugar pyrophosphorylase family protein